MTDQPVREPIPPDPEGDRSDEATESGVGDGSALPPAPPSAAEGAEEDAGERPPRPSQAEGDRDA